MHYATATPISLHLQWKASKGNKFFAIVPSTYKRYARDMTILIASSKQGWFYVDNPYLGIKVNKTMVTGNNVYTIVNDINVKPLSTERNSFWIETSHDVTLYLMSTRSRSSDGYHVLPYKSLAKKHVISTTEPSGRYFRYKCHLPSFISVGAVHDNTKISFKLNTRGYITYRKRRYKSGDKLSITLHQYDTFEVQHCHDLSGTFVTSSAPIGVVSGNQCNRLGRGSCSQLADMVPPIRSLSRDYVVPDLPDRPGSVIHIVATVDGTSIDIKRKLGSNQTTKTQTLNAGQFCETTVKKGSVMAVSATRSVLVSQAVNGTFRADPMMLNVPGEDQFQSSYRFSVPAFKFKSFVSVIVESSDLSGLRLDGNPLKMNKKAISDITISSKRWLLFSLNIGPGSHHFVHPAKRPFGLIVYGDGHRDGYAYSAGMTLKSG
ncbi:hypothetical protein KUTeg_010836 [Tegillarca granosa]|uniref:IgGFc-binding protein N-terminal domain-containing protein n=1 Tax=Tegillarca granosa TaxID=220873 RepID=A0ABQ9F255_TEGGR|nr:hypothetical protein KUTeg_010836 [Tegillarca granosa]